MVDTISAIWRQWCISERILSRFEWSEEKYSEVWGCWVLTRTLNEGAKTKQEVYIDSTATKDLEFSGTMILFLTDDFTCSNFNFKIATHHARLYSLTGVISWYKLYLILGKLDVSFFAGFWLKTSNVNPVRAFQWSLQIMKGLYLALTWLYSFHPELHWPNIGTSSTLIKLRRSKIIFSENILARNCHHA